MPGCVDPIDCQRRRLGEGRAFRPHLKITKGSVSYLSSPCFSTSIGGIGGPGRAKRGILAVMYWISIIRGGPPYVRHLEAISQAKRLWINTNQKAAKQTIGAKWTQLIPPASGRNRLSRKTCR